MNRSVHLGTSDRCRSRSDQPRPASCHRYLVEENRVLKDQLRGRRLRLTVRLAVKGKALGWKLLGEVASIMTPDTILAWGKTTGELYRQAWGTSPVLLPSSGIERLLRLAVDCLAREQSLLKKELVRAVGV